MTGAEIIPWVRAHRVLGRVTVSPPQGMPARLVPRRPISQPGRPGVWLGPHFLAVLLAASTVLVQISYPLLDGEALRAATIVVVLLFCTTSLLHAGVHLGTGAAARLLAVAGGLGLVAEMVGVQAGVPFGQYSYAGTLGPQVLGVPVVVPLAWTMMAYPCLLLGRRLTRNLPSNININGARTGSAARVAALAVAGGAALAAWDLFLDPQMVSAGHWTFDDPTPALPGVAGIPLTNYAGWLVVAVPMIAALHLALPATDHLDRSALAVPSALLAWTWLGSALANVAFFGRAVVGAWGFVGMSLTVAPYLFSLRRPDHQPVPPARPLAAEPAAP